MSRPVISPASAHRLLGLIVPIFSIIGCIAQIAPIATGAPPVPFTVSALGVSGLAESDAWSALVERRGFKSGQVGFVVMDEQGRVRASLNPDRLFKPASNQKVLVAVVALETLGPKHEYVTSLLSNTSPRNGVLKADLVVRGTGDPNISGRFAGDDPLAIFRAWARSLKSNGLRVVAGDLVVDDTLFDDQRFLPSWKTEQFSRAYSAQIGALNLNDNCISLRLFPKALGAHVGWEMRPSTRYVQVENRCRGASGGLPVIGVDRHRDSNRIVVKGKLPVRFKDGTQAYLVTVNDPGLYFGTVLREVLIAEGIEVRGEVIRDRSRVLEAAAAIVLHEHRSTLARDLPVILRDSQNLHAEVLLKAIGAASAGLGSVSNGREVVEKVLSRSGISTKGLVIADGSGLSRENRVSPRMLCALLHWVRGREYDSLFRKSLAVAGESGTLRKRYLKSRVRGRVYAKTGYISGVSALSGYVVRSPGGVEKPESVWTFSILVNGFPRRGGLEAARSLQESITERIVTAAVVR